MQQNKITILSTRPLPPSLIKEAARQGIAIEVEPFIETEAIQSVEVQQEIEQAILQTAVVVFTSMNAVEAVAQYMNGEKPDWAIYCLGQTTRELVIEYFGEPALAGTADNAAELANLVVGEAYINEVIFFCGNQRRDELPAILNSHDIAVVEIAVYHTIAIPHRIIKPYNGILFFSPSAVDSFFLSNTIKKPVVLFAIGSTTAAAIQKHSAATVITGAKPGKDHLVEKMINYFVNSER